MKDTSATGETINEGEESELLCCTFCVKWVSNSSHS
uniref:Uncharacterized protein n=1 Tax=Rhizophora mucronata TaxID=61149 RepID=A0A2P2J2R7_RHIMU